MAGMQNVQRIKRQNCGSNVHVHHNLIFGSRDQIGSMFAVENGDAEGSMSYSCRTGLHGVTGESIYDQYLQTAEVGSSSSCGFLPSNGSLLTSPVPDRETPYSSESNLFGTYTSSSHSQSLSGSRSACKRKSSMDDVIGSVGSLTFRPIFERRERDCSWFTEDASFSRGDAAFQPLSAGLISTARTPVLDTSYSGLVAYPLRARHSQHLHVGSNRYYNLDTNGSQEIHQASFMGNSRELPDALTSSIRISRSSPATEHTMAIAQNTCEIAPFNQSFVSSAAVPWCASGPVSRGSNMNHTGVHRDLSTVINSGAQVRSFPNGALLWMGVPNWMRNTFDPTCRSFPAFPYREFTPQGSLRAVVRPTHSNHFLSAHSPTLPSINHNRLTAQGGLLPYHTWSRSAIGSMISGSQAAPEHTYGSFGLLNRSIIPPLFRDPTESVGASPLYNFCGMPFQGSDMVPSPRSISQRLPSQETFDHALLYNGFDIQDHQVGWQPDVDNMSYEELLALEERIGYVNTGLSEENISKCLKTGMHSSYDAAAPGRSEESEIKCSICQEEYMEGDALGQLSCSHSYHTGCIKQWLGLKNQCPICKATALSLP